MSFLSLEFCILLAGALLLYYAIPPRFSTLRSLVLLAACGCFYYSTQRQYLPLLPCSILLSYLSATAMDRIESPVGRRVVFWFTTVLIAGAMIVFRYSGFIADAVSRLTGRPVGEGLHLIAPLGISVYTLRILSYLADVSRRKYAHWTDPVKYAVYVSFFPAILAGPLDRADDFLPRLEKPAAFSFDRLESGGLLILWGLFVKLIAADRLSLFAGAIYRSYGTMPGSYLLLATFAYGLLFYCDFSAYSNVARGIGELFGLPVARSFAQPYMALSVGEFWRRWHVSLSAWLRDYIYIPLGGNRCGRFRKYLALTVAFLLGSLWYGSGFHTLVWGGLNALFVIFEDMVPSLRPKVPEGKKGLVLRCLQRSAVFLAVSLGWVFFFGDGTKNALKLLLRMVTEFRLGALGSRRLLELGLYKADFGALFFALAVQWLVDGLAYRGKDVLGSLRTLYLPYRWFLYLLLIFSILLFGVYAVDCAPAPFLCVRL